MILHHYPQNDVQVKALDWTPLWITKVGKFVVFMRHLNDYDTIESPYEWCHRPGGHWNSGAPHWAPLATWRGQNHLRTGLPHMSCWNVLLRLLFTKLPTSVNCTFSIPTALTFFSNRSFLFSCQEAAVELQKAHEILGNVLQSLRWIGCFFSSGWVGRS